MADDPPIKPTPLSQRSVDPSDAEICRYVAEQCAEMRRLSRGPRLRTINYLLDMVRIEAEKMAREEGERR